MKTDYNFVVADNNFVKTDLYYMRMDNNSVKSIIEIPFLSSTPDY